ncbi:MAG: hypothetical protein Unbinned1524contig1000_48 [Prokaryotic dsDNA virus sp.]|nr:MAG: hypothetical protein Unbinned1524contig1000_48 [Prokaryotic dsDNA virus sp.]|tara:strand:- start:4403 stop:4702 length:300 start_codon:yes stop_codon:yes gene_type:complete
MDKFLEIPVTGQSDFLLSVSDVIAVTRVDDTTTLITYNSANTATLTHTNLAAQDYLMRDSINNQMTSALATSWTNVVFDFSSPILSDGTVVAVSAIAIA